MQEIVVLFRALFFSQEVYLQVYLEWRSKRQILQNPAIKIYQAFPKRKGRKVTTHKTSPRLVKKICQNMEKISRFRSFHLSFRPNFLAMSNKISKRSWIRLITLNLLAVILPTPSIKSKSLSMIFIKKKWSTATTSSMWERISCWLKVLFSICKNSII